MTDDKSAVSGDIPDAAQDISTEELVDNGYPSPEIGRESQQTSQPDHINEARGPREHTDPGRTRNQDSIDASSRDTPRDDDGYTFSAGHETTAATGVGKSTDQYYDEHLQRVNEGRDRSDGTLSHRQANWDKKRITQALCSDLPISQRQRKQVVTAMEQLDLDRFGHQKAIERVCLGVVAVIVNDQRVEEASDPDDVTPVTWEDEFKEIAEKFDVGMSDLSTIKETVRNEIGEQPPEPGDAGKRRDPNLPEISPGERPNEYWERCSNTFWIQLARHWKRYDENVKQAIPEEKRDLVEQLRRWEPWNRASTADESSAADDATDTTEDDDGLVGTDESREQNADAASVDEEAEQEVEALINQMADAADDNQ